MEWLAAGMKNSRQGLFATAVADGNLDETLDIKSRDEVGTLAEALRNMVARLKDMIRTTEEKERHALSEAERARKAVAVEKLAHRGHHLHGEDQRPAGLR